MKKIGLLLLVGIEAALLASPSSADLYVVQVGDESAALTNASTATFVKRFMDNGTFSSTIALPIAASGANKALTLSGTATSEGFLTLSTNGQYLTLGGYGVAPGQAAVPATDSTVVNRVIGRIEVSSGTIDTSTGLTDAYIGVPASPGPPPVTASNGNIRSVVSSNGTEFWTTGSSFPVASAGVRYATLGGTTSTQLSSTPTNVRVANIFAGQLYTSSASSTFQGVSTVGTGLPTTTGQTTTLLPGFPTATGPSSYDYWFQDADTLYVADDRGTPNGGIQKWELSAGNWSLLYTLPAGATAVGARGLAGTTVGGNAVLYATTTQSSANNLITITDTGPSSAFSVLATAPTNTAFRGVEFTASAGAEDDADFDGDGDVDGADFLTWQRGLGGPGDLADGDADGDNVVTGLDLAVWRAQFGLPAVPAVGAIPEPACLTLAALGMIGAVAAVRRRGR